MQTRAIRCLHNLEYKIDMLTYCDSSTQPMSKRPCNSPSCPQMPAMYQWQTAPWSKVCWVVLISAVRDCTSLSFPDVNSIKKLQVYFTLRSHQFESTKSLHKFPLQASNLYLQSHFAAFIVFFMSDFTFALYSFKKSTLALSL